MNHTKTVSIILFSLLSSAFASQALAGPININTANMEQLDQELTGVGPAIALRIVEHREAHGQFSNAAELALVKGVGEKILSKNASFILVE
jgi:competence protein ComEA